MKTGNDWFKNIQLIMSKCFIDTMTGGKGLQALGEAGAVEMALPPPGSPISVDTMASVAAHVNDHIGRPDVALYDATGPKADVGILVVRPSPERDFYTLVTAGMSDHPMNVPAEYSHLGCAELMICVPRDWPMDPKSLRNDPQNYWPLHLLYELSRYPRKHSTWLGIGHTVPSDGTSPPQGWQINFAGDLVLSPRLVGAEFHQLVTSDGRRVHFHAMFPLYKKELELKRKIGCAAFEPLLDFFGVTELLDIHRKCMVP